MNNLKDSVAEAAEPVSAASSHAARQRERILDAAEKCFIDSGFEAASMAEIAATAGVSAGLIYRYFASKSAIVRSIIARHLETEGTGHIDQFETQEEVVVELLRIYERWRRGDDPKINAALFLELTAASTRDPDIARAVRDKDQVFGQAIARAVRRIALVRGVKLTMAEARGRAVVLHCLVEGLASRAVRDPELKCSTLKPALESIIAVLFGKSSR